LPVVVDEELIDMLKSQGKVTGGSPSVSCTSLVGQLGNEHRKLAAEAKKGETALACYTLKYN